MKHVKKSVLLWYSAREMYDLVVGCEDYPKFLPWCDSSTVLERHEADPAAGTPAVTTPNEHAPDTSVVVALVDGPFSQLDGTWNFIRLGSGGNACKIEFDMAYAFASTALEVVVSPVFDKIANTFVDSFVRRAEQVYGPR